jgi:hypothetical protein
MAQQLKNSSLRTTSTQQPSIGAKIRHIADQLTQETDIQIKATSRILSAAAQISDNHDRLISEIVDMVEEDIDHQTSRHTTNAWSVELLKQQFRTLAEAKSHFGLTANTWVALAKKVNSFRVNADSSETSMLKRLDTIEAELKSMRVEIGQILLILNQLLPVRE